MKHLLFSIGLFLSTILLVSCSSDDPGQISGGPGGQRGQQATSVEVTPVETGTISDQIRSYGTLQAQDVVQVTPQVSNRVTEILVDLGDEVSRGQVMARIRAETFRDAVEQAEAQIRQTRSALERDSTQHVRQQRLFERDLISESEYEQFRATWLSSRAQYESARAALTQSRENLANTEIRSPVDGVVLERMISVGDVASSGQPAFEVANTVGLETRVHLARQDWQQTQVGQEVMFSLTSRSGEIARGVVSRKSPRLNPETGLGEVVISVVDEDPSLSQGALVQARINLETRDDVVVIPRSALVETVDTYIEPETGTIELERTYSVFVAQGDSVSERRELELGIEQGDRIQVLSGLAPGDQLIITGHTNLDDGSRIRVAGQNVSRQSGGDIGEQPGPNRQTGSRTGRSGQTGQ